MDSPLGGLGNHGEYVECVSGMSAKYCSIRTLRIVYSVLRENMKHPVRTPQAPVGLMASSRKKRQSAESMVLNGLGSASCESSTFAMAAVPTKLRSQPVQLWPA